MGLRGIGSFPLSARGSDPDPTPAPETERGFFTVEMLELFAELEHAQQNPRTDPTLQDKSRRLASLLGLLSEWTRSVCHVNDGSSSSDYPPGHLTDLAFQRVRAVREQLLAACAEQADKPKVRRRRKPAAASPAEPAAAPGSPVPPSAA
jgi:hypothetical protein